MGRINVTSRIFGELLSSNRSTFEKLVMLHVTQGSKCQWGASDGVIHSRISLGVVTLRASTNRTSDSIWFLWEHDKVHTSLRVEVGGSGHHSLPKPPLLASFLHNCTIPREMVSCSPEETTDQQGHACIAHSLGINAHEHAYLLGLLAMIKCSICSYQCDN